MSTKTILQVPIDTTVRDKALKNSKSLGFSSLQEAVRVFLYGLADKQLAVTFTQPAVKLSAKNEKRYIKMIKEVENGKAKPVSFDSIDELMNYLNS